MNVSTLLLQLLTGLAYGMLLFMIASGMSIIFGLMNVVNMTHGTFFLRSVHISPIHLRVSTSDFGSR